MQWCLGNLIESGVVPVVRLTKVFRQVTDSHIITNAQSNPIDKNIGWAAANIFK